MSQGELLMRVNYFVDPDLIPDDGSRAILKLFEQKISAVDADIYIFPDVHYKRGARTVNGMLISANNSIFPACLGVENCGFSFGRISSGQTNDQGIRESFSNFSTILKDYRGNFGYTTSNAVDLIEQYLIDDYTVNAELYRFVGISTLEGVKNAVRKVLDGKMRKQMSKTLCSLGGGNHFFEIHKISELFGATNDFQIGEYIFILHSDSVGFGDIINLLYSNLSEWDFLKGFRSWKKRMKFRLRQLHYFLTRNLMTLETLKLIFSQQDYRSICADSKIGRSLLFAHNLASIFGEINRDLIIENWATLSGIQLSLLASHSHDSVRVENGRIIHRNGVQRVGNDKYFLLPSAMGGALYILKNPVNRGAFFSANHGLGRLKDKHIARTMFTEQETESGLERRDIALYRVGKGNLAEQNMCAFKDADSVLNIMSRHGLGEKIAATQPIAIIKG